MYTRRDQRVGVGRTMQYCVFNSQRMIDWWCDEKDISNRAEGVSLGKELYATGILKHGMHTYNMLVDGAHQRQKNTGNLFSWVYFFGFFFMLVGHVQAGGVAWG